MYEVLEQSLRSSFIVDDRDKKTSGKRSKTNGSRVKTAKLNGSRVHLALTRQITGCQILRAFGSPYLLPVFAALEARRALLVGYVLVFTVSLLPLFNAMMMVLFTNERSA